MADKRREAMEKGKKKQKRQKELRQKKDKELLMTKKEFARLNLMQKRHCFL